MNKEIRIGVVGSVDSGKCFAINTPILLYDKTVKMVQDITPLDILMGDDLKPRNVYQLSRGNSYMYKIIQTNLDGHNVDEYIVNLNHVLCLYSKTLKKVINISLYSFITKPDYFCNNHLGVKVLEDGTHSFSEIKIEKLPEKQDYYGFSINGNHRFLLGDYTITHNSTITGVLTKDILDDGRGKARSLILKHPHEKESGRTSCISQHYIREVNKDAKTEHVINFIDLAGHEKYLKTTISGITKCLVDYAAIVVGSNMGVLCMTKEHINIIMALNIPTFIIMTKIDIAPIHIKQNTLKKLTSIFSKYKRKIEIFTIENSEDYENFKLIENKHKFIPIFMVSSVIGTNIDILRNYIFNLNPLIPYEKYVNDNPNFVIENRFVLKGIGLVVSGVMKSGIIKKGDVLQMGPFNNKFRNIIVKNIHNNFKEDVEQLCSGHGGSFNIKVINSKETIKRNMIRKGIHILKNAKLIREFYANVLILHHPTTISCGYQPYIHCGNVSQTCQIIEMDKECLRIGEKARVKFRFLYRPEFILVDAKIIFREGRSKGVGRILELC